MPASWDKVTLGRTGLSVSPLGLAGGYGLDAASVERAVERGINYLYWGTGRKRGFGEGVRRVAARAREKLVLVVQSNTHLAPLMRPSVERALSTLKTDYADVLLLGWWNEPPPPRIFDAALALKAAGKVRHLMISGHHRTTFTGYLDDERVGAIMVRYNAAHPGAETDVFQHLPPRPKAARPGVVTYTATRWGHLLHRALVPEGEPLPRASDCYRFSLASSDVDVCLCAPKDGQELTEAFAALDRGPLSPDELAWMRRVGAGVRARAKPNRGGIWRLFEGRLGPPG